MAVSVRRRCQDDSRSARPADSPLRYPGNRKRKLAVQESLLTFLPPVPCPGGPQVPPTRAATSAMTGTPRRARDLPVDSWTRGSATKRMAGYWTPMLAGYSKPIDSASDLLQRDLRPKREGLRDPCRGAADRIHSSGR